MPPSPSAEVSPAKHLTAAGSSASLPRALFNPKNRSVALHWTMPTARYTSALVDYTNPPFLHLAGSSLARSDFAPTRALDLVKLQQEAVEQQRGIRGMYGGQKCCSAGGTAACFNRVTHPLTKREELTHLLTDPLRARFSSLSPSHHFISVPLEHQNGTSPGTLLQVLQEQALPQGESLARRVMLLIWIRNSSVVLVHSRATTVVCPTLRFGRSQTSQPAVAFAALDKEAIVTATRQLD